MNSDAGGKWNNNLIISSLPRADQGGGDKQERKHYSKTYRSKDSTSWDVNFMNPHKTDSSSEKFKNHKGHIYKCPSSYKKMKIKEIWWPNFKGLINPVDPNTITWTYKLTFKSIDTCSHHCSLNYFCMGKQMRQGLTLPRMASFMSTWHKLQSSERVGLQLKKCLHKIWL